MENQLIIESVIKYGGGALIIYLIILLVNALTKMLQAKTSNGQGNDIQTLKNKVNNEFSHELQDIRSDINELWREMRRNSEAIARIETKINK